MEGEQRELSLPSDERLLTFAELADELCPKYMAMGVSYDEYWHGNYAQLAYYLEANEIKQGYENYTAWLQGGYFFDAVSIVLGNAFRKKGEKPQPYLDKPYEAKPKAKDTAPSEADVTAARQKVASSLSAWADNWKSVYGGDKK